MRLTIRNAAILLSALLIPLSMLISNVVTAFYKSTNPRDVDVSADLAYLRESLVAGFGSALIIGAIIVWLIFRLYRRNGNFLEARLPIILITCVSLTVFTALIVNGYINAIENQYRQDHALRAE